MCILINVQTNKEKKNAGHKERIPGTLQDTGKKSCIEPAFKVISNTTN